MPVGQKIDISEPSPWFELVTTLAVGDTQATYKFEFRWNDDDSSWYFDLLDSSDQVIATGVRVVLGVYLGSRFEAELFRRGVLVAIDLSATGTEATLTDLGTRVVLVYYSDQAVMVGRGNFPGVA